jgi:hypothetical protein
MDQNISDHTINDPWNGLAVDLSNVVLSAYEKQWIGTEVSSGRQTGISLSKRFNLCRKKIHKYSKLVKKGIFPESRRGRPRRLDDLGVQNVKNFFRVNNITELSQLKMEIKAEAKETHKRKYIDEETRKYKRISKRSVQRYLQEIMHST